MNGIFKMVTLKLSRTIDLIIRKHRVRVKAVWFRIAICLFAASKNESALRTSYIVSHPHSRRKTSREPTAAPESMPEHSDVTQPQHRHHHHQTTGRLSDLQIPGLALLQGPRQANSRRIYLSLLPSRQYGCRSGPAA